MKSSEITEGGFYWWTCPEDDGPKFFCRGKTQPVKVIVQKFGGDGMAFLCGHPQTYILQQLPGDFVKAEPVRRKL